MKRFKSKYILRPFVLYTTIAIVVLADLVLSKHIAEENIQIFELSLIFVYIVIFIWTYFNMLFKSFDEFDIANEIFALEKEKKIKEIRWEKFEKSTLLLDYKIAHEELKKSNLFIHFLRSKEDITHENNLGAYISIILILGISQYSFDYLKPIGPIIYISIIFTYLALCMRILIWEGIERKNFISPINIGHIIVISILFLFGKGTYIRN